MDIKVALDTVIKNFQELKALDTRIEAIAKAWICALEQGHKVILCGNGGSASDAQHLAAELIGRYKRNRPSLAGLSLNTDTSAITAIANDFGYDQIFARQLEGLGKKGDVLVGLSTSGNSPNIIKAFEQAKKMGILCIAFTGEDGGKLMPMADITLNVPSTITNYIQEMHIASGHILCEYVENYFFSITP